MRIGALLLAAIVAAAACGEDENGGGAGGDAGAPGGGGSGGTGGSGGGDAGSGGESNENCAFELGTGHTAFEPLTAGQEIPIIAGNQGGFHVWNSLRLRGYTGVDFWISMNVIVDGEEQGGWAFCKEAGPPDDTGLHEFPGQFNLIYGTRPDVEALVGKTATLRVRAVSDADLLACGEPATSTCDLTREIEVLLGEIVRVDVQPGG